MSRDGRNHDTRCVDDTWQQQPEPTHQHGKNTNPEVLADLRAVIDEAAKDRPALPVFFDRLEQQGVRPVASVQTGGRWNGVVYEFRGRAG